MHPYRSTGVNRLKSVYIRLSLIQSGPLKKKKTGGSVALRLGELDQIGEQFGVNGQQKLFHT